MASGAVDLVVARRWSGEPLTPAEAAPHARVTLAIDGPTLVVTIAARLVGDPPPPGPPRALHGLWEHEVVECFVAGAPFDRTAPYVELELGPHGHWLAWSFAGYRARTGDVPVTASAEVRGDTWHGRLDVPLAALPPRPWRVHACAVHGPPDARSYLVATPLGGDRPDFHRVEAFVTPLA